MNRASREAASSRRRSAVGAGALALALILSGTVAGVAAHAAPPTEGSYRGTSTLMFAGDNEVTWEDVRPISFEIDAEGYLDGLAGEYFWTCVAGGEPGTTQYLENAPIPQTLVEVGEPFSVEWQSDSGGVDYSFEGVVNADGTAEGLVMASIGVCGASILSWSAATDLPDPEPSFEIETIAPVSVWDIARGGITVNAAGFEQHDEVTVTINGESQVAAADFFGDLSFTYIYPLTAGSYAVTLSTDAGSVSESFEVIADAEFFDEHTQVPLMFATPEVQTDAAGSAIDVFARYLVTETSIDVLLNGAVIDTIATGEYDSVEFSLTEPLSIGQHTIELAHPAVSVSKTIEVVSSADGAPAPAGEYAGVATQDIAGTGWTSETNSFPLTFTIDAEGNITDFTTEYRWVCWLAPDNPTGITDLNDMPSAPVISDRAFSTTWQASNLDEISVSGTIDSSASASGTIFIDAGSCGLAYLEWNAEGDIDTDPEFIEVAAEAPTRDGNDIIIPAVGGITYTDATGTVLSGIITLTEGQTLTVTATADAGYVLTEGPNEWVFSYEATDPDPDPETPTIPEVTPAEDDLDAAFEGAVLVPAEALAGDTITVTITGAEQGDTVGVWLFSTPVYLGAHDVDAAGNVSVTIPAATPLGDHKIAVWNSSETLMGWGTISITEPGNGDDDGDGTGDDGDGTGGEGDGTGDDGDGTGGEDDGTGDSGNETGDTDAPEQNGDGDLAVTGGNAAMGIVGYTALVLLTAGAGLLMLRRRNTASHTAN